MIYSDFFLFGDFCVFQYGFQSKARARLRFRLRRRGPYPAAHPGAQTSGPPPSAAGSGGGAVAVPRRLFPHPHHGAGGPGGQPGDGVCTAPGPAGNQKTAAHGIRRLYLVHPMEEETSYLVVSGHRQKNAGKNQKRC